MGTNNYQSLVRSAASHYRSSGRAAYYFARGKLRGDPVFSTLLARGLIPNGARILDLGCGQGLLAAWLEAAQEGFESGYWIDGWPPPGRPMSYRGIERNANEVARAIRALGARARFEVLDICTANLGTADVVVILDVLHYLDFESQRLVLLRVHTAIAPSGQLLLRVGDARGGLRFRLNRWVDRAVLAARGYGGASLSCRTLPEWLALLGDCGFSSEIIPMGKWGTSANILLRATSKSLA